MVEWRPESRVVMAILKPSPNFPRRFSLGTTASSNVTVAVDELWTAGHIAVKSWSNR